MRIAEALLPEFDREMAILRKTLDRLPDEHWDWQPHAKSMKLGHLANHLADIVAWPTITFDRDVLDLKDWAVPSGKTREEVLAAFDKNRVAGRQALHDVPDETANGQWSLSTEGHTIMTLPKMDVIRTWVLNHMVHHRAQMGVYLRLLDIPVPGVYGPSADEM